MIFSIHLFMFSIGFWIATIYLLSSIVNDEYNKELLFDQNFGNMNFAQIMNDHRHRRSGDDGPIISHDDFKFQSGICYKLSIPCTGKLKIVIFLFNSVQF